jgi:hypothetical protein
MELSKENRKKLSLSGVSSIDFFSDNCFKLTVNDCKMQILGDNLKVLVFNKEKGDFLAEGKINEVKFNYKKQPLIKRIFK